MVCKVGKVGTVCPVCGTVRQHPLWLDGPRLMSLWLCPNNPLRPTGKHQKSRRFSMHPRQVVVGLSSSTTLVCLLSAQLRFTATPLASPCISVHTPTKGC
eukprot:EG_transcript_72011